MPAEVGWGKNYYYSRAIVHVDGDGFFAACEVARDPSLKGKPVVTGAERGIVSAATYEAKALGISRGIRLADVHKICPETIILSSDYELYTLFSLRMYEIMRRYTPVVEEYGIDECFGDITGMRRVHRMGYEDIARKIKDDLTRELNISFSLGLSSTKVLAKIASKYEKPNGFTPIRLVEKDTFLKNTPIQGVWGIGANTGELLRKHGIQTAYDFTQRKEDWVRNILTKPTIEIWKELQGEQVYELETEHKQSYHSIQKTKTFTPHTKDSKALYSELSKNVEAACHKARKYKLTTAKISFYLKTTTFRYRTCEISLPERTNEPNQILTSIQTEFMRVFQKGLSYRATGVTLMHLEEAKETQLSLFTNTKKAEGTARIFEHMDKLTERFGNSALFLGSSMKAIVRRNSIPSGKGVGSGSTKREGALLSGYDRKKILSLPYLGEVI